MKPLAARLAVLLWTAAFVWWCRQGAAAWLTRREYEEAATWVSPFSLPWLGLGVLAGAVALIKPTRWRLGALGAVSVIQMGLVIFSW